MICYVTIIKGIYRKLENCAIKINSKGAFEKKNGFWNDGTILEIKRYVKDGKQKPIKSSHWVHLYCGNLHVCFGIT